MITLENNRLVFRFDEVHEDARCSVAFQRTLRIPDDGKTYPLPPGLGRFPLRHVDDFEGCIPRQWSKRGGVLTPMHQAEALWLSFDGGDYPFAVKIATGKINAVTGESWANHLNDDPQDYVVVPEQPWLDGYSVEKGMIRQFVAMPLGDGYSVEEQITGKSEHGGLQIIAYPIKAERYEAMFGTRQRMLADACCRESALFAESDMSLSPGGRMKQKIYDDPYGLDAWDQRHASRCFVTIANSVQWMAVTGERPPNEPPSAQEYTSHGLPWFDYYDADNQALAGADALGNLKSVADLMKSRTGSALPDNDTVGVPRVHTIRPKGSSVVREAEL